jgi:hypothetical protein
LDFQSLIKDVIITGEERFIVGLDEQRVPVALYVVGRGWMNSIPSEIRERFPSTNPWLDSEGNLVIGNVIEQKVYNGKEWETELSQTGCWQSEAIDYVVDRYLDSSGFLSLLDEMQEWFNNGFEKGVSWAGFENGPSFYTGMDMRVLGWYKSKFEIPDGSRRESVGLCLLAASPYLGDRIAPFIFGVELGGQFLQIPHVRESLDEYVPGKQIRLDNLEDAEAYLEDLHGEVIYPLVILRYDDPGWEDDPLWDYAWFDGYNTVFPFLKNENDYVMEFTKDPTKLEAFGIKKENPAWSETGVLADLGSIIDYIIS